MEKHKEYLGDSVYVAIENGMIKLMTEHAEHEESNIIYLEPSIHEALNNYVKRIETMYSAGKPLN